MQFIQNDLLRVRKQFYDPLTSYKKLAQQLLKHIKFLSI